LKELKLYFNKLIDISEMNNTNKTS